MSCVTGIQTCALPISCLDCPDCVARCVNGLDIAMKMKRARRLLA
jgi:predicted aldo/keto reductase-like oxidoreductase